MTTTVKTLPIASIPLTDDQRRGVEEASRWVTESLAELGAAHLELEEARHRYGKARARAESCVQDARQAQRQHDRVMKTIALMLELPPGEWSYDPDTRSLARKPQQR